MKQFYVAVSTRCVEWHAVTASTPAAALAAYHDDKTKLDDDEVVEIEGIRVIDRANDMDVTIAANAPTVQ